MLTCKQVSERASDDIDGHYKGWQKLQIRLHLMICSHCRRFRRHLINSRDVAASVAKQLWNNDKRDNTATIMRHIEQTQSDRSAPKRPD